MTTENILPYPRNLIIVCVEYGYHLYRPETGRWFPEIYATEEEARARLDKYIDDWDNLSNRLQGEQRTGDEVV